MTILVLTNFYPPHHIGGYELGCRDVVDMLSGRGHNVHVLTSTYGVDRRIDEQHTHRWFTASLDKPVGRFMSWLAVVQREIKNQTAVNRAIREFNPDLIYIWNMRFASLSIALAAEASGKAVIYYVSDEWPTMWQEDFSFCRLTANRSFATKLVSVLAKTIIYLNNCLIPTKRLTLNNIQCTSRFIERKILAAGFIPKRSWIIPWDVNSNVFAKRLVRWPPRRVLYAGQLMEHKGAHTAIASFINVAKTVLGAELTLTVAGGASYSQAYERRLRALALEAGIESRIQFIGRVERDRLVHVYSAHDIFLFPSEWEEPFSIALIEAMASSLAVIATATGGTPEIVRDEQNALVFSAGNPEDCSRQLTRLLTDRTLYERVANNARNTVEAQYLSPRMLEQIEDSLSTLIADCSL